MANLSPLAATFELRFNKAWKLCDENKRGEAETVAAELLMGPRLGPFHQAGMHLLLAMSPDNYLEHALTAVRLYTEMSAEKDHTDTERKQLEKLMNDANRVLNAARQDQAKFDRDIQKLLASGMTMDELHDAQIEEMNERLDSEEDAAAGGADPAGGDVAGSRDVAGTAEVP